MTLLRTDGGGGGGGGGGAGVGGYSERGGRGRREKGVLGGGKLLFEQRLTEEKVDHDSDRRASVLRKALPVWRVVQK